MTKSAVSKPLGVGGGDEEGRLMQGERERHDGRLCDTLGTLE